MFIEFYRFFGLKSFADHTTRDVPFFEWEGLILFY